jgi:hypothetical protein
MLYVLSKPSSVSDDKYEANKKEVVLGSLTTEVSYSHLKNAMLYKPAPGGPLQISYFIDHIVNHKIQNESSFFHSFYVKIAVQKVARK